MSIREELELIHESLENEVEEIKDNRAVKNNLRQFVNRLYACIEEMPCEEDNSQEQTVKTIIQEYLLPRLSWEEQNEIRLKYTLRLEEYING